jgi:hypothetical protein
MGREDVLELRKEDIKNFLHLISWGARNYSRKLVKCEYDYEYFYSEGLKSLDKCIRFFRDKLVENPDCLLSYRKAKKPDMRVGKNPATIKKLDNRLGRNVSHPVLSSIAFSKYFRTALFRRFDHIRRMAFASKRNGMEISFEDGHGIVAKNFGSFSDIEYNELVEDILSKIDNKVERMLFLMKTNPPEELWDLALLDNRRKLKVGITRRLRTGKKNSWGGKGVSISDRNIRDFLCTNGVSISSREYTKAIENVKKIVSTELKGF